MEKGNRGIPLKGPVPGCPKVSNSVPYIIIPCLRERAWVKENLGSDSGPSLFFLGLSSPCVRNGAGIRELQRCFRGAGKPR